MALLQRFAAFFAGVLLVSARDPGKLMRTAPSITNSLVNLGKMEISIHLNPIPPEYSSAHVHDQNTVLIPPKEVEHSCACSDFKPQGSSFLSNPTEVINKILRSNDLFKDPTSSVCCGSHEQESSVFLELVPNPNQKVQRTQPPQLFQFPHFEKLFKSSPTKSKQVEILLFPKRKDMVTFEFPSYSPKKKESKPDFKIGDVGQNLQSASIKKDLTLSEKNEDLRDDGMNTITPTNLATNNNSLM